jgi:hypothetical protein
VSPVVVGVVRLLALFSTGLIAGILFGDRIGASFRLTLSYGGSAGAQIKPTNSSVEIPA